jgi:uncharacterized membrane protein YeaQ/YmgE (transglycosylase-associated protein family)
MTDPHDGREDEECPRANFWMAWIVCSIIGVVAWDIATDFLGGPGHHEDGTLILCVLSTGLIGAIMAGWRSRPDWAWSRSIFTAILAGFLGALPVFIFAAVAYATRRMRSP